MNVIGCLDSSNLKTTTSRAKLMTGDLELLIRLSVTQGFDGSHWLLASMNINAQIGSEVKVHQDSR